MHSKSDNIIIITNVEADKVVKELLDSLKNIYQNYFESTKGNHFVFDCIHLLCYK